MNSPKRLVPLAIVVALVGGLTWLLLGQRRSAWDVAARRAPLRPWRLRTSPSSSRRRSPPERRAARWTGRSTSVDRGRWTRLGLDAGIVRATGRALTAVTAVASLLAALALIGFLVPTEWWSGSGRRGGGELADPADRVLYAGPAHRLRHRLRAALARPGCRDGVRLGSSRRGRALVPGTVATRYAL